MQGKLPPLREVIKKYHLSTKQTLGQNFILDQQLTDKIVKKSNLSSDMTVIEIGPGPGGLTRSILSSGHVSKYYGIEMDQRCYPLLHELFEHFDMDTNLVEGDALKYELHEFGKAPRAILANLPYNISTVILIKLLQVLSEFESLTLMFQKEVALRIIAKTGTKAYGRLSVMAQWIADIECCFDISPQAFVPAPKVTSSVVNFMPKQNITLCFLKDNWPRMEKTVAAGFQQRRKMLRQSLKGLFGKEVEANLFSLNISPTLRAENLTVSDFYKISQLLD